ncbi:cobalamin biosynthesis protein [Paracoccus liaowanqingii]|uniref:Cobalamin biosynthesis protein n=1 Tax=Paracoccus liaowanqingii TaxID=2560053 RepID=A0A4P7HK33_9RHOB|nr:cobalamin biosynthesis protein [Paracoccus liaowanqingii]QBX33431.1 cobalamin biosynthesis protein [Paracoccus liaowanqingii]
MRIAPFRIAGIGCRPGTSMDLLATALQAAGGAQALATIPERAPEIRPLAAALDLPLHLVAVAGIDTPTQSPRILARFRTGSVAEAAALAASRTRGGRLIQPRRAFGPVTIAIAEVP